MRYATDCLSCMNNMPMQTLLIWKIFPVQEQSKSDAKKLFADISNLVSNHIQRQKELVCFFYLRYIFSILSLAELD